MSMLRRLFVIVVLAASNVAWAQTYPARPVSIVVPFPAGDGVDLTARVIGAWLAERMGSPFLVENRPGAGATIGAGYVARSAPDGYTLLLGSTSMSIAPILYKELPYSPTKDFTGVILLTTIPQILIARSSLPAKTVAEVVTMAQKAPGKLNIASGGNGTGQHLAAIYLMSTANILLAHIPYKGTGPAMNDIVAGNVDLFFTDPSAVPVIQSGKVKALGVTTATRYAKLPNVPAVGEMVPGFDLASYYALLAPAAVPRDIIARLNAETNRGLQDPGVRQKLESGGLVPAGGTPEYLNDFMQRHASTTARIMKGVKVDVD